MEMGSIAKIISYNLYSETVCASAAKISTTKGNAYEIFEKSSDDAKNRELIKKVLSSGHKSIIEHATFTIALWNVSAFVEQFFIECRLASFTVKSRRYVDFSGLGYYIPPDLDGDSRTRYCQYMDALFSAYEALLNGGVPKEDARFLLPYSFNSNFYCTINARELIHLIHAIKYGRGRGIPELENLADQIVSQLEAQFPSLLFELDRAHDIPASAGIDSVSGAPDALSFIDEPDAGAVNLLQAPARPRELLEAAYRIGHPASAQPLELEALLHSRRPRELEQLPYTFAISDITLSGITHIVRHRMQSIIIPPLQTISHEKLIVPATVKGSPALQEQYIGTLKRAADLRKQTCADPALSRYHYYFALSGNVTDIITTMNARELMSFIRLRSCNRAQWEIRNISIRMLKQLRDSFPELFDHLGPACYTDSLCPEGRLSCGKRNEVIAKFGQAL